MKRLINGTLDLIADLTRRASSRKFIVLVIAVWLHTRNAQGFTGENLVWVFCAFLGMDVVQKWVERGKTQ